MSKRPIGDDSSNPKKPKIPAPKTIDNFLAEFKENEDINELKKFVNLKIIALKRLKAIDEHENEDDDEKNRKLSDNMSLLTQELHEILEKIKAYHITESTRLLQLEQNAVSKELLLNLQKICINIEGNLSGYLGGLRPRDSSKKYKFAKTYLNGPISYYYLISPDRKKRVYLFGDFHSKDEGCDKITEKFIKLEQLIENTISTNHDKIIDVFFEIDPFKSVDSIKYENLDCFLTDTRVYFVDKGCFIPHTLGTKKDCKDIYPNARFHASDVRYFYCDYISHMDQCEERINKLILDQLGKIEDKDIQKKIKLLKDEYTDEENFFQTYAMDAYLLARLFRSYKTPYRHDFGNVDVSNAIIYAGHAHIIYYLKFLKDYLGYTLISSIVNINKEDTTDESYTQCMALDSLVDGDKPFLPFFDHDIFDMPRFRKIRRSAKNGSNRRKRISHSRRAQKSKSRTKQVVKSRTKRRM